MIQLTAPPLPGLFDVPRPAGSTPTVAGDFALALAGVAGTGSASIGLVLAGAAAVTDRQADAGSGNALPVAAAVDARALAPEGLEVPPALADISPPTPAPPAAKKLPAMQAVPAGIVLAWAPPAIRPGLTQALAVETPRQPRSPSPTPARAAIGQPTGTGRTCGQETAPPAHGKVPDTSLSRHAGRDPAPDDEASAAAVPALPTLDAALPDDKTPAAPATPAIDLAVVPAPAPGPESVPVRTSVSVATVVRDPAPASIAPQAASSVTASFGAQPLAMRSRAQPAAAFPPPAKVPNIAAPSDVGANAEPVAGAVIATFEPGASIPMTAASGVRAVPASPTVATPHGAPPTSTGPEGAPGPRPRSTDGVVVRATRPAGPESVRPQGTSAPAEGGAPQTSPAIDAVAARFTPAPLPARNEALSASTVGTPGTVQPPAPSSTIAVASGSIAPAQAPTPAPVGQLAEPKAAPAPVTAPIVVSTPATLASASAPPVETPAVRGGLAPDRPAEPRSGPRPLKPAIVVSQPAAQAFAAAMFATSERPAPRRGDAVAELAAAFPLAGLGASAAASPIAVQAVAAPQAPPLDTRTDEWIGAMIDRIETLRDEGAGARETRIRLSPDALGRLDVAIRQEGDSVTVRIAAETPAARALLAEAAPRLTELAEARGLKLAGAGFEGGGPGSNSAFSDRQPRQPDAPVPTRPRAVASDPDDAPTTDTRIA